MAKYTRKQAECAIRFWQKALNEAVAAESEEDQEKERQAEEEKAKADAAAKEKEAKAAEEKAEEAASEQLENAEGAGAEVDVEAGLEGAEDEKVEESAPGSAKYPANTVGAVCELLRKSDPFDRLFIRLVPGKEECMVVDIDRKITMKSGVTYMDIAKGSPLP